MAHQQLPFFVYGTLMRGFRNFERHVSHYKSLRWVANRGSIANATLVHFEEGYPGMYHGSGAVYGEILTVDDPSEYEQLMRGLDALEEYFGPNHPSNEYDRVEVDVNCGENTVRAWTYFGTIPQENAATVVQSGDWRAFMEEHNLKDIHAE
ncbi:hypothetical protein AC1031_001065 [Aphanomyces cochlioides]|nr:hypothetical protein AC1031_001065 [Aphanomyces cochlioides]